MVRVSMVGLIFSTGEFVPVASMNQKDPATVKLYGFITGEGPFQFLMDARAEQRSPCSFAGNTRQVVRTNRNDDLSCLAINYEDGMKFIPVTSDEWF
ncbi:hypothetical protein SLEP1_g45855 [Rubroshorea leprosula]|uniref:Uncharacterized protein n=1 Tax=Rubroshorea leprosula TaxID=152421 RepID=A0AAV5LKM3_9ROSI|nr:hypothetical protein SLEP1_g45855 [Rubroshorea leprosula]